MSKGALIIGASNAGLQAALDLADAGIEVHLVEPSPFVSDDGAGMMPPHLFNTRLLEAAKHPNITTWTGTRVYRVEGQAGDWTVELRQHPRYIDLARCTACGDCVAVCPVEAPGTARRAIHLAHAGQPGCAAIDKLGKPPCSNTCPGGIHVQGYVALTAQGRFGEALDLIRDAIPFPGICGRICTHPCEINCRRAEVDKPVAIRQLKRFLADWELEQEGSGAPGSDARGGHEACGRTCVAKDEDGANCGRVAIVGAGPGGMATAKRLAGMGYRVTVFEKLPVIGGMMAVGIPEYRLPRDAIAREYRHILDMGVELRLNSTIGPQGDYSLDDLLEMGFGAVCLAVGAHRSHSLRIPGEDLPGVVQGTDLLRTVSLSQQLDDPTCQAALDRWLWRGRDTRAAVLGGGNTAMDVARSLRRLGLEEVRILYRRTRAEMPAMAEEVEDAEREGVSIDFLVSPVRVLGDAVTGVTGLECLRMKLGEPDVSGRRRPVPIAGSEFVLDLDLVAPAIGQAPDLELLGPEPSVAITRDERINVDAVSFMTSRPGVFACGDAITSDKMAVIEAISLGKQAAAGIDAYLRGIQPHEMVVDARQAPIARREMAPEELALKPQIAVPTLPLDRRLSTFAEVELGYDAEQAVAEARRCLVCGPCAECMACVRACKPGAVVHDEVERLHTLNVGAILYAAASRPEPAALHDGPDTLFESTALDKVEAIRVVPDNPLHGSAAAARALFDLFAERQAWHAGPAGSGVSESAAAGRMAGEILPRRQADALPSEPRVGVFVCRCGGLISDVVDAEAVRAGAKAWRGVIHAEILSFACSPEAAETMERAIGAHALDRVVLAACSCCAIDQACYSCTYQRVRCKQNLGILPGGGAQPHAAVENAGRFEFVNIREQCAWAHSGDPAAATAKAAALTAAAVAKVRLAPCARGEATAVERSALVLGSGPAARTAVEALARQGIAVRSVRRPDSVTRAGGCYQVSQNGAGHRAAALILAPTSGERQSLLAAFGNDGLQPRPAAGWESPDTHRPGVFLCDPGLDPQVAGPAAAGRLAAWLGRVDGRASLITAKVDPARCRACGTCVEICEFGAPYIRGTEPQRTSWIDPTICAGCGVCAAHCPSGAIVAGYSTEAQLEAMLEAILD